MKRTPIWILVLACIAALPSAASGQAFRHNDLWIGRYVKPPVKVRRFAFGVDFEIAPVRAVLQSQIDNLLQQYPQGQVVVDVLQETDISALEQLPMSQIKTQLLSIPGLSQEEQAVINGLSDADKNLVTETANIVKDKDKGITFSIEPWVLVNFKYVELYLKIPIAGFKHGGTSAVLGNVNLDVKLSNIWGKSIYIGLLYGVHFYFPSGTTKASTLGLQNAFKAPMYFYQYLTTTPYVGFGVDFKWVVLQTHVEFPQMTKVRGSARHKFVSFLRYGAAVSIVPHKIFNFTIAMDGMKGLKNASEYNTHTISAGFRFRFFGVNLGMAVQVPVVQSSGSAFASFGGLNFGSPSKYNIIINAGWQY